MLSIRLFAMVILSVAAAVAATDSTYAEELIPGPVPAEVLRVIDGDTIYVAARIWLGQRVHIRVRLDGVDAPELRGQCDSERELALRARDLVSSHTSGQPVTLYAVHYGKYAGRIVAQVHVGGGDLAALLLGAGLAREYDGGKRMGWCG